MLKKLGGGSDLYKAILLIIIHKRKTASQDARREALHSHQALNTDQIHPDRDQIPCIPFVK